MSRNVTEFIRVSTTLNDIVLTEVALKKRKHILPSPNELDSECCQMRKQVVMKVLIGCVVLI